ncbi:hypothetical protein Zmor_007459 [Zophobas morio]|uniref:Ionotropic receptor n=1 Tax=Zophobas morio TaxID=2755281 RepID=A0AA38IXD9_9CUCU|nr:hypothetical protein Zmor_007459 [Zophobas morio]
MPIKNLYLFILITSTLTECSVQPPSTDFVEQQLQSYFIEYKRYSQEGYNFCLYLNANKNKTKDISNWFIKYNSRCLSLILSEEGIETQNFPQNDATFIFLQEIEDVENSIKLLHKYHFWNSKGENHFILCTEVNNTQFLPLWFSFIWKKHLIQFVFVLVDVDVEIFIYNPFAENAIVNLRHNPNYYDVSFLNKLTNLFGYRLRVALYEYDPLLVKVNGTWHGKDFKMLKLIAEAMNATIDIIEPTNTTYRYIESFRNIIHDKADFCLNSIFVASTLWLNIVDYTYPHAYNKLVILMPVTAEDTTESHSHNLISIFTYMVWILIIVLVIITAAVLTFAKKATWNSFSGSLIYSLGCLIGYSFYGFKSQRHSVQFQLITFILGAMILRTIFTSFLVGTFLSPCKSNRITTIEELRKTNIDIYISRELALIVPKEFSINDKLIVVSMEERTRRLYEMDTRFGYAVTQKIAQRFLSWLKEHVTSMPFYIIEEPLMQGFDIYIFQKHSPFVAEINLFLMRERSSRLVKQNERYHHVFRTNYTESGRRVVLGLHHLHSVFYILTGGLSLSFFVFIIEVLNNHD